MTTPAEKAASSIRLLFFDTNEAVYCALVAEHTQVVAAIQRALDEAVRDATKTNWGQALEAGLYQCQSCKGSPTTYHVQEADLLYALDCYRARVAVLEEALKKLAPFVAESAFEVDSKLALTPEDLAECGVEQYDDTLPLYEDGTPSREWPEVGE